MLKTNDPKDLSQSFCCPTSPRTTPLEIVDTNSSENDIECSGGVCSIPKKSDKPLNGIDETIPQLDKIFSQLLGSVLGSSGSTHMNALENIMKGSSQNSSVSTESDTEEEDEGDEGYYSEGDEGDEGDYSEGDEGDEGDEEDEFHSDKRWDTFNKLIESHINITRVFSYMIRDK
jgi:hypothetical protein